MRQRKLLLPPFHGEAIEQYTQLIGDAVEREIDRWPLGKPFALCRRRGPGIRVHRSRAP
jgi:cytochrome P450